MSRSAAQAVRQPRDEVTRVGPFLPGRVLLSRSCESLARALMKCFVGLDVSLKLTAICVVDQEGNIVREGVADVQPDMLTGLFLVLS
jgi:hypothetical protein